MLGPRLDRCVLLRLRSRAGSREWRAPGGRQRWWPGALVGLGCCACTALEPPESEPGARAAIQVLSRSPRCREAATPIHTLQGSGSASPLAGREVLVEGVVTGVFLGTERLGGFFLQAAEVDSDPSTSEGLFIHAVGGEGVSAGELVRVRGRVSEFYGLTQLNEVSEVSVCGKGEVRPAALAWFEASAATLEAYEGMLVSVTGALTLTDNYRMARYGELSLARSQRVFAAANGGSAPNNPANGNTASNGAASSAFLTLDDGYSSENVWPTPLTQDDVPPRVGSTLREVTGILTYAFGSFRIIASQPLEWQAAPRPAPPRASGNFTVAALNLDNYFMTLGSRGARSALERERQRDKLVSTLAALGSDLFALTELENAGNDAADDLLAALDARTGSGYRVALAANGAGSDALRSALFYRPGRLVPLGAASFELDPVFKRPPLWQMFDVGGFRLLVAAVHLKSKRCSGGAGSAADDGSDGCSSEERELEARALSALMGRLPVEAGADGSLLLGDFNAYPFEAPIQEIAGSGLTHLLAGVPQAERYSYVFAGEAGLLDHAFSDARLQQALRSAAIWHVNADEAELLDYRSEHPPDLYAADAFRSSDHDPIVLGFELP